MIHKKDLLKVEKDAIERYTNRYKKLGISPRSLGWGCEQDQLERFKAIIEQYNLEGKVVMDVGCGFSDFFKYLRDKNIFVKYIGVDIVPDFIEYCKKEFPDQKFLNLNIMTKSDEIPNADIIISLGALNFKLTHISNFEYTKLFIEKAYKLANELVIIDFLSNYRIPSYPKEDFVYYHLPEEVFKYAISLTNNVRLIHDYKPIPQKEFMIILRKN